ncbi:MAG: TetR/AcrR family transcriptional regulator [Butyricicoccus sp.]
MPPKPKHTREQIIAAALELVSEKGMEMLTARELGARLGTSARPIFTAFKNMEEVQQEVIGAAVKRFQSYAEKAVHFTPAFKQLGMQVLLFAAEEPRLYQLLFMRGDGTRRSFDEAVSFDDRMSVAGIQMIQKDYGLSAEEAAVLFRHVWIFTFGLGALCATGVCCFSDEEINDLLGQNFMAMLARVQSGEIQKPTVHPQLNAMDSD